MKRAAFAVLIIAGAMARAEPAKQVIAVCSPGSPGTTADAQPAMDAFAAAASAKAGVPVAAVYDETEDAGVARLKAAGAGMVSLPFFLKHEQELDLHARLVAVQKDRPVQDQWALVAKKDRVHAPAALDGFAIASNAAFAPAFVRGVVLGEFGALPATTRLQQSVTVLSALRRAANGDAIAVVLDGPQLAALGSLPFAGELEVVAHSPALPAGLIVTVGDGPPAKSWTAIEGALVALRGERGTGDALDGIHIDRFAKLDGDALAAARKAYANAR